MCIMKFFNSQNCQRRKYKTVWLNIDNRNCSSVSFWYGDSDGSIRVTAKDFARAKTRYLNFAYAGGINQANYTEVVSRQGSYYTFTYYLNKITVNPPYGIYTPYDYAKAIFKNGAPVDTFSITIDVSTGEVTNTNFLTTVDKGYSAYLYAESSTDDTTAPMVVNPPVIRVKSGTSWESKNMTTDLAINMQTRLNSDNVPGYASRRNIDSVSGPTDIPIAAWFIQFYEEYIVINVIRDDAQHHFEFDSTEPRPNPHTAYYWYADDGTSDESKLTLTEYQNTIAY